MSRGFGAVERAVLAAIEDGEVWSTPRLVHVAYPEAPEAPALPDRDDQRADYTYRVAYHAACQQAIAAHRSALAAPGAAVRRALAGLERKGLIVRLGLSQRNRMLWANPQAVARIEAEQEARRNEIAALMAASKPEPPVLGSFRQLAEIFSGLRPDEVFEPLSDSEKQDMRRLMLKLRDWLDTTLAHAAGAEAAEVTVPGL
jgi:hypothetical protein